jgi:hypothetical protein
MKAQMPKMDDLLVLIGNAETKKTSKLSILRVSSGG